MDPESLRSVRDHGVLVAKGSEPRGTRWNHLNIEPPPEVTNLAESWLEEALKRSLGRNSLN